MITPPQPLIEVFATIPDLRRSRGKRHPLPAMLSLACCAVLCGYRSDSAIAEWGRNYGAHMAQALGFTYDTPCAATLHTVFRHLDRAAIELDAVVEPRVMEQRPISVFPNRLDDLGDGPLDFPAPSVSALNDPLQDRLKAWIACLN